MVEAPDLIGIVHLEKSSGRLNPLTKVSYGHAKSLVTSPHQHSYSLNLINTKNLALGENCKAELKFNFFDWPNFNLKLKKVQTLHLYEGGTKIGVFYY